MRHLLTWLLLGVATTQALSASASGDAVSPVRSLAIRAEFAPLLVEQRTWSGCAGGKLQCAGILVVALDFRLPIEVEGMIGNELADGMIVGLETRWRTPWLNEARHRLTLGGGVWYLTGASATANTVLRADLGYEIRMWGPVVAFAAFGPEIALGRSDGPGDQGEHEYRKGELAFRARIGVGGRFAFVGGE
jgi:hypothetical protein